MFVILHLNSCANFSSVACLWLGCLLKTSHASYSSFSCRLCFSPARNRQCSRHRRTSPCLMFTSSWRFWVLSLPVAFTLKSSFLDERTKVPLFTGTQPVVSGGALVVVWPSSAEGRLYVARGSGIIVRLGCEPPARRLVAHRGTLPFRLSCKLCSPAPTGRTPQHSSFQTELQALQSAPLPALLAGPLCSLSLCPSRPSTRLAPGSPSSIPSPGSNFVVPTRQCQS